MKEVAIVDAKNNLSALIAEIEATGEDVLVTRHGRAVARLSRAVSEPSAEEGAEVGRALLCSLDRLAESHPASTTAISWESFKSELDENRR